MKGEPENGFDGDPPLDDQEGQERAGDEDQKIDIPQNCAEDDEPDHKANLPALPGQTIENRFRRTFCPPSFDEPGARLSAVGGCSLGRLCLRACDHNRREVARV